MDQVILLDQQPNVNLYYNVIDLFVLSSRSEAFPNVLAEAMATGVPCITTDAGDAREIIGDDSLVVPVGSADLLSNLLIKLLTFSKSELSNLGDKARNRVINNYDITRMIDLYSNMYLSKGE